MARGSTLNKTRGSEHEKSHDREGIRVIESDSSGIDSEASYNRIAGREKGRSQRRAGNMSHRPQPRVSRSRLVRCGLKCSIRVRQTHKPPCRSRFCDAHLPHSAGHARRIRGECNMWTAEQIYPPCPRFPSIPHAHGDNNSLQSHGGVQLKTQECGSNAAWWAAVWLACEAWLRIL